MSLNNEHAKEKWRLLKNTAKDEFGNLLPGHAFCHPDGYANMTVRRAPDDGLVTNKLCALCTSVNNPAWERHAKKCKVFWKEADELVVEEEEEPVDAKESKRNS